MPRDLRIGLVGPLPPPSGGMANQTRQLARLLGQEGAEVEIVQVNAPYWPHWIESVRGVRALFRLVPFLFRLWRVGGPSATVSRDGQFRLGLASCLRRRPSGSRAAADTVVVNYRGGDAEEFFDGPFLWVRPTLATRARSVIVPSRFSAAGVRRFDLTAEIVPNVIDLSPLFPRSARIRANRSDQPHLIVTRNLESIYDILPRCVRFQVVRRQFPGAKLTVAGSGPKLADLQSSATPWELHPHRSRAARQ